MKKQDPFRDFRTVPKSALEQQHLEGLRQNAEKESAEKAAALAILEETETRSRLLAEQQRGDDPPRQPPQRKHKKKQKTLESSELDVAVTPRWDLSKLSVGNKAAKSWIISTAEGYFCSICKNCPGAAQTSQPRWISKPCVNKDMNDGVRKHLKSTVHIAAARAVAVVSAMPRHLETINEAEIRSLRKRFNDMYYVIKHDRPLSDCEWLFELETDKGLPRLCRA
jgi:hypothetical protein